MRTRLRSKVTLLFIVCAVLLAVPAVAAIADQLQADADAVAAGTGSTPHANTLSATQNPGTTVTYDFSAAINNTGNATNDVFKVDGDKVTVTNTFGGPATGSWLDAAGSSPSSFEFTAYDVNKAGVISVKVPCDAAANAQQSLTVKLDAVASNGQTLTGDPSTLTYTITASGTKDSSCTPANTPPVAVNDSYTAAEDTPLTVPAPGVLGNDTDANAGDTKSALLVSQPANGNVNLNQDGSFTFTPNANFNGSTSFTYKVNDGTADSNVATVSITVTADNDAPVANNDTKSTDEDTPLTFPASDLVTNDSAGPANESDQTLTVTAVGNAVNGTVSLQSGTITFTPASNFSGQASFKYTVCDSGTPSKCSVMTAIVNVNVNPVNDPPVATNDTATTNEDVSTDINVLANDTDVDSATLTAVVVNGPAHGSVTQGPNGTLTYTPTADYNGTDGFTYKANDGAADSNVATVSITVTPVNDEPQAVDDDAGTTPEDTPLTIPASALLGNDSTGPPNESGQQLHISAVSNPPDGNGIGHGTAVLSNDGSSVTFTPDANYNGQATFDYTVCDDGGTANGGQNCFQSTAIVRVTVSPVNDVPSFTAGANQTVLEDSGAHSGSWATSISAGPSDESGQTLTFTATNNNNALFSAQPAISANGTLTYTPAANANGSATVTVTLKDNGGTANSGVDTSAPQTFQIDVTAVNDAPSFDLPASPNQTVLLNAGAQSVDNFATNFSPGPSNESSQALLKYVVTITNTNNTNLFSEPPAIDNTGKLTYKLAQDAIGTATVSVKAQDDGGTANNGVDLSAAKTFTIDVNYGFSGFLQPINWTAHQVLDTNVSTFKAGSTVPVKFYLTDANGNRIVQPVNAQWTTPQQGGKTNQAIDESVYTETATSGSLYKWDSTAQQYIYNWSTKAPVAGGYYYKIGVTLPDGNTQYTYISLR